MIVPALVPARLMHLVTATSPCSESQSAAPTSPRPLDSAPWETPSASVILAITGDRSTLLGERDWPGCRSFGEY